MSDIPLSFIDSSAWSIPDEIDEKVYRVTEHIRDDNGVPMLRLENPFGDTVEIYLYQYFAYQFLTLGLFGDGVRVFSDE